MAAMQSIVVHVYAYSGGEVKKMDDKVMAIAFAKREFRRINVYKVKVWDTEKGPIERNNPNAKALVFEIV